MKFGTFVLFETDFPDDSVWDANDNLVKPAGQNVMIYLTDLLRSHGIGSSDAVQHSFYGWRIDAVLANHVVRCILQGGQPWVLICDMQSSGLQRIFGDASRAILYDFVLKVHDVLKSDPRIANLRWLTREQYENGTISAASTPRIDEC